MNHDYQSATDQVHIMYRSATDVLLIRIVSATDLCFDEPIGYRSAKKFEIYRQGI